MDSYLSIVKEILENGNKKKNRTEIDTIGLDHSTFTHDMAEGFPLLTTKRMAYKSILSELEFFIKGITDKKWLQDRNNPIWNEWCNPEKVPYGHDEETKQKMKKERDLGPIYGFQWRHFNAEYKGYDQDYTRQGIDQLDSIVNSLKNNPNDRRMVVSSWNPSQQHQMALPPCHLQYQVLLYDNKIHLNWTQRSVDTMLGLPFNITSYATLLHLLAKESGYEEGTLTGFLGDTHIYENQIEGAQIQIKREPKKLPKIETKKFTNIFEWKYTDSTILNYKSHPKIRFHLAV